METFSALLAICAGKSPVPTEFPTQRPVTRSFDVFFVLRLNKRSSKQSWGWWFETLSRSSWRQCDGKRTGPLRRLSFSLQWLNFGRNDVPHHRQLYCFLNNFFRLTIKVPKPCITGPLWSVVFRTAVMRKWFPCHDVILLGIRGAGFYMRTLAPEAGISGGDK